MTRESDEGESRPLAERTSAEAAGAGTGPVLLVPVGAIEQHGPHLPLDTDTRIAGAVARAAAEASRDRGRDVIVAPALAYGASGEHEGFAGTVSIGTQALTQVLLEYGRSASGWASRIVFVNGHGGNVEAATAAVARLVYEGRDAMWAPCAPGRGEQGLPAPDAHAGRIETSLLLHLAPDLVRVDRMEQGETSPLEELLPRLRAEGMRGVSPNGVLGDPRGADAEEGRALFEAIVRAVVSRVCEPERTPGAKTE